MRFITIDPVKVASLLAHQATLEELVVPLHIDGVVSKYTEEEDLFEETETVLTYKEDVQNVFNNFYEYYFGLLTDNHIY